MDHDRESDSAHKRQSKRSLVLLAAKVRTSSGLAEVKLRNLSRKGALLEADSLPPVGSELVFERGETAAAARVAWVSNGRFGIEFLEPIEESEVLIHVGRPRAMGAQPSAPGVRRTGFRGGSLTQAEREMAAAWVNPAGRSLD